MMKTVSQLSEDDFLAILVGKKDKRVFVVSSG